MAGCSGDNNIFLRDLETHMRHTFAINSTHVAKAKLLPVNSDSIVLPGPSPDSSTAILSIPSVTLPTHPRRTAFAYRNLGHRHLIRLLRLQPGDRDEELSGTIFHCSLRKAPAYEALSYVWGSEQKPFRIQIRPGGDLAITESLHTALIRLRHRDQCRVLWIDAICINQGDNAERSEQVLLMPYIYSQAMHVRAWLGPDDDGSAAKVLELIETIGRTDFASLPSMDVSQEWMQDHGLPLTDDPIWDACVRFWQRPWFRRVWVIQEFVRARDLWVLCGPSEKHWKKLICGVELMKEYSLVSMGLVNRSDLGEEQDELQYGMECFSVMSELKHNSRLGSSLMSGIRSFSIRDASALPELFRGSYSRMAEATALVQAAVTTLRANPDTRPQMLENLEPWLETMIGEKHQKQSLPSLMFLMTMLRHKQSTDPRDHLFALLGLTADANDPRLKPDYDESLRSIMVRYAKAFVGIEQVGNILTFAGCAGRTSDLPSWVPDWTSDLVQQHQLALGGSTTFSYAAASDLQPCIRVCDTVDDALTVGGSFLGKVVKVLEPGVPHDGSWGCSADALRAEFVEEISDVILEHEPYVTGEDADDAVWRTLIGNLDVRGHVAPASWKDEFVYMVYLFSGEDLADNDPQDAMKVLVANRSFIAKFSSLNHRYAFGKLDNGLFALVPRETKPQDFIFLPSGSKAPFAVRRCESSVDEYQILATCYVHGLMFSNEHRSKFWNEEEICVR